MDENLFYLRPTAQNNHALKSLKLLLDVIIIPLFLECVFL